MNRYLNDNGLALIVGQLFGSTATSTIREELNLRNNDLRSLPIDAFFDVNVQDRL